MGDKPLKKCIHAHSIKCEIFDNPEFDCWYESLHDCIEMRFKRDKNEMDTKE